MQLKQQKATETETEKWLLVVGAQPPTPVVGGVLQCIEMQPFFELVQPFEFDPISHKNFEMISQTVHGYRVDKQTNTYTSTNIHY